MTSEFNRTFNRLLMLFAFIVNSNATAQEFDFGIDLRINNNKLSNRFADRSNVVSPGFQSNDLNDFQIPDYNFGFINDQGEEVFVRFNQVNMVNNFELPISLRYTTKKGFFLNLKVSGGNHYLEYQGEMFRNSKYYFDQYGNFASYDSLYSGTFYGQPVNGDPFTTYDDTTAYINWFNSQVDLDPYSQSRAQFVEELKFRSFHLWFGKKFLKHKRVHPFVNVGLNFRTAVKSYRRKHFEIQNPAVGQTFSKSDLSQLSTEIPSFSSNTFGIGFGIGFDIYRYHFAATTEYSFNLSTNFKDKDLVFDYRNAGAGFRTLSVSVGVDLFSHDFKTKNSTEEVYSEEFQSLSSNLNKTRTFSIGINVRSPILSRMNSGREFSLLTIKENPDPVSSEINTIWQSLSFSDIEKISWIPKFEFGFRVNVVKRLDFEIVTAFSRVIFDTKVQEFNGRTINNNTVFDSSYTNINYAVYRSTYVPWTLGGNIYITVVSKPSADLRFYAGAAVNWFALITPDASSEFGVNGKGNDIYQTMEDVVFHGTYSPDEIQNGPQSYYSDYAENINPNLTPGELLARYDAAGKYSVMTHSVGQKTIYPTVNIGAELELNRFLIGMSGDFSVSKVDNFLVQNYFNFNLNLGYILVSKSKIK